MGAVTGCTKPIILQQRVVEVEKIVLKDTTGNIRFEVAVKEDGSLVQTLRDKKGNDRIALMVDAEGVTRQRFFDENGKTRMESYVFPADHPEYADFVGTDILNKDGKMALTSYIDTERVVRQTLADDNEIGRVSSYVFPADHPRLAGIVGSDILNKNGKPALVSYIDTEHVVRQVLSDENGTSRISNYVFPADHPKLAGWGGTDILNKDGKTALRSVIDTQRVVRHQLMNENGVVRIGSYINPTDYPKMAESAGTEWINANNGAWIRMRTTNGNNAYQEFYDKTNKERISLNIRGDGLAEQRFGDATGNTRIITYTTPEGHSGFDMLDTQEKLRFQTVTLPNGKVAQSFMDREKHEKSSTTVDADGSATHYVEKGTVEKIWNALGYISPFFDVGRLLFGK